MKTNSNIQSALTTAAKAFALVKREPKRTAIALGCTAVAAATLAANEKPGFGFGGAPNTPRGWETHELVDENNPSAGRMVAATVAAPKGWGVEGGVHWHNPGDPTDPYKMSFTAVSPDGKQRLQYLPAQNWASGEGLPSPRRGKRQNAESVVRELFMPKLRPGAKIVTIERDADSEAKLRQKMEQMAAGDASSRRDIEAAVATIEYEEGGVLYREEVFSSLMTMDFVGSPMQRAMAAQVGTQIATGSFQHSQIITSRAPASEFAAARPTFVAISDSFKTTDRWSAAVAQYHRAKSGEQFDAHRARMEGSRRAHQTRMAGNQAAFEAGQAAHRDRVAAFDASQASYREGQRSQEEGFRSWLNGHLGRGDFHNPHTGNVETHDFNGGRLWQDSSGRTFETETWQDDPRMHPGNWGDGIEELGYMGY